MWVKIRFKIGDAECVIKSVADGTKVDSNKSSIVIELTYGNNKFLFMSDHEKFTNGDIKKYPEENHDIVLDKVDVLKVAHHRF